MPLTMFLKARQIMYYVLRTYIVYKNLYIII